MRPAGEHQRGDQRPDRRGGAQRAQPRRADVQDRAGEQRQQRHRPAEQHREQVQQDRAEQDRRPPDEAQPLQHPVQAGRLRAGRLRLAGCGRGVGAGACGRTVTTHPAATRHMPAASR